MFSKGKSIEMENGLMLDQGGDAGGLMGINSKWQIGSYQGDENVLKLTCDFCMTQEIY